VLLTQRGLHLGRGLQRVDDGALPVVAQDALELLLLLGGEPVHVLGGGDGGAHQIAHAGGLLRSLVPLGALLEREVPLLRARGAVVLPGVLRVVGLDVDVRLGLAVELAIADRQGLLALHQKQQRVIAHLDQHFRGEGAVRGHGGASYPSAAGGGSAARVRGARGFRTTSR
jgi:hypothetical protein